MHRTQPKTDSHRHEHGLFSYERTLNSNIVHDMTSVDFYRNKAVNHNILFIICITQLPRTNKFSVCMALQRFPLRIPLPNSLFLRRAVSRKWRWTFNNEHQQKCIGSNKLELTILHAVANFFNRRDKCACKRSHIYLRYKTRSAITTVRMAAELPYF